MKQLLFLFCLAGLTQFSFAQTNTFPSTGAAGIGTTSPDPSSLFEVISTSKGILIPRMTKTQRDAIVIPSTGLMIFQTNSTPGFYYYNGTVWTPVSAQGASKKLNNLTAPTAVNQSLIPGTTNSVDLGSASILWRKAYFSGDALINGITVGLGGGTRSSNSAYGFQALFNNTSGSNNTAAGNKALYSNITGSANTAYGLRALYSNTTGYSNVAIGIRTLYSNAITSNLVAVGDSALYTNTTGTSNTAIGSKALYANTNGSANTANGFYALYSDTTGSDNTANGFYALYSNTVGNYNTANGDQVLASNTSGSDNTGIGGHALGSNTTGIRNTAIGSGTLSVNTEGSYNTALGAYAGVSFNNLTNATVIGSNAFVDASNKVRVGDNDVTSIGGIVGWTTFPSDGRYKKNIKEDVKGLAFINILKPITYTVDMDALNTYFDKNKKHDDAYEKMKKDMHPSSDEAAKIVYNGFIAQDVEAAARKLNYEFSGVDKPKTEDGLYGLRYSDFVVPLVKSVQELSSENDELKSEIGKLKSEMNKLKAIVISGNQQQTNDRSVQISSSAGGGWEEASLERNIPNPFNHATTIDYTLPQQYSSAKIIITDKTGKILKEVNISGSGKGSLNIDATTLSSGAYNYSLYLDNKLIDTKQMERLK